MTELEKKEDPVSKVENLLNEFEAVNYDVERARYDLLNDPSPNVHIAANGLRTLWRNIATLSSQRSEADHLSSSNTATHSLHEIPGTSPSTSLAELPHSQELMQLVEKETELLSHVANLLDYQITPATRDHPAVSPAALLEQDKRRKLKQLAEAEWWLKRESITNSTNVAVMQSFVNSVATTKRAQAQLRNEIHTIYAENALTLAEEMLEGSADIVQNSAGDLAAFRDACRLMVVRHDMQHRQNALTRRMHAIAFDGDDSASRAVEDTVRNIGEKASRVGEMVGSLQESVVDDSVRDAIGTLRETARIRHR